MVLTKITISYTWMISRMVMTMITVPWVMMREGISRLHYPPALRGLGVLPTLQETLWLM